MPLNILGIVMQAATFKSRVQTHDSSRAMPIAYTWYRSWHNPLESLWSLLQKFALLNHCSATDIRRLLGRKGRQCAPYIWTKADVNLADLTALDSKIIQNALQLEARQISEGTVAWYLRPHEHQLASQQRLRICTECYRNGFHSALHQLLIVDKCPAHNCPLLELCSNCKHPLPLYELTKEGFDTPYQCTHCAAVWWDEAYRARRELRSMRVANTKLQSLSDWLLKRKAISTLESVVCSGIHLTTQQQSRLTVRLQRLAHHWGNLHESPAPVVITRSGDLSAHVSMKRANGGETDLNHDEYTQKLYKSVRRFLIRQAGKHRKCFRQLVKRLCTSPELLEVPTLDICPEAYAIVFWRVHFEQYGDWDASRLFIRRLRRVGVIGSMNYNFSQHGLLALWAQQRVFALDCLALFEESRCVARQAVADGIRAEYFLRSDKSTCWIAKQEGDFQILHWWRSPFKHSGSH